VGWINYSATVRLSGWRVSAEWLKSSTSARAAGHFTFLARSTRALLRVTFLLELAPETARTARSHLVTASVGALCRLPAAR